MSVPLSELNHIWNPLTIGPTEVNHRIMMSGQTLLYAEDNILSDRHIAYYRERARGGVALLLTGQQAAHPLSKGSFHMACTAWEKRAIPQYAKLADAVHEHGAKQFVQLFATGVHDKGTMMIDEWHPLWGASRVPSTVHREIPLVMEQEHIDDLVVGFGQSAANVQVSGLDGVEIHGHASYLIGQFLSRAYNKRTDAYGGSVRRRCQLPIEIADEIRKRVGTELTLGMRLSFDEFMGDAGITPEEAEEELDVLAETGLFDYFSVSGAGYHTLHMSVASMTVDEGHMIPAGKRAKAVVGDRAKVFIVGRILDLRMADEAIADAAADMVAMTRAQMAEPFLVKKALEGREREIVRCVGVNDCVARLFENRQVICMMNPAVGRERAWGDGSLNPIASEEAKTVTVVGGGPAGMRVAAVAATRGHRVKLVERGSELGGHLNLIKQLPTRHGWQVAIDNLERQLDVAGVEVELGTDATSASLTEDAPGSIVCATGSTWDCTGFSADRPDRDGLPGVEHDHVIDVATATYRALADPSSLGKRVIILDDTGQYLPLGLAEVVAGAGAEVEVISPHLFVGEDVLRALEAPHLFPRLAAAGVTLTPQHFIEEVRGSTVDVTPAWGDAARTVDGVDTVVLALLRSPNDSLYLDLRERLPEVHRIGDAVAPRKPAAVIYEGEKLGRSL